ncbi:hypothetical protein C2S53_006618 [Perilla frutescens var. hirtella]|uniref:Uncharacterized protein n=1 Tax=Perilla frutescens var. hirtella TaxID=608512 RepID=A0AAD4J7F9_PERFH|nr:hypothetical protein C2S53_006618 [Perilla frutescens var. hirtella]
MGSKVVVTYKRKRLFSRSDHSLVNLHSDTSSDSAKSKTSDTFPKQEGPIAECTLQNNNTGFGICHAYSKDNIGEDVLQCENHDSDCCSQCHEKHAGKPKMLFSDCAEQKYSLVSNKTQKFTPEQKCSPKADVEDLTCHLNVLLDGNPGGRYKIDSAGQSKAEEKIADTRSKLSFFKLGSEYEDNCKEIVTVSQPPDACSGAESDPICLKNSAGINCSHQMKGTCIPKTSTLEETDKLHKDQNSSLCNNSGMKRKLTSALITFCRRSKRSRGDIASESETLPAAGCLVDLKNEKVNLPNSITDNGEKEIPEDIDNSCYLSTSAPATSTIMLADIRQHFPRGEAEDASNAASHCCQDSMTQQKVRMDVQDHHHINVTTQRLSDGDVMSRRMHRDVSGRGDSLLSLDLTTPPHASHNIDCNLPLDDGSDENQPVETSEVHDSLGSISKIKEDILTLPVQRLENGSPVRAVSDKGKSIVDSPPVPTGNSSRNNYIQFFPESRNDNMLHLAPSSLQPSNLIGLSLQPEQMVEGRPSFPPSYEWLNVQVQPREPFPNLQLSTSDRTQSFSRERMMLDNILTRARAVRGNRSSFLDKFDYPTTWLEEELDSLWIGVRRHGRGNWDAILGDRRLHFLPWKTPWDLAERWQVEQSRLLCSMPVSQRRYTSPSDLSSENLSSLHQSRPDQGQVVDEVRLSLGHSHPVQKGFPLHFMNKKTNRASSGSGCWGLLTPSEVRDETSSSTAALMNGSLPHWLRTTAEIPPGPSRPTQTGIARVNQQPWWGNRCIPDPPLVVPDEHRGNKLQQEDLIIIPSDASSEETISDHHSP